MAKKKNNNLWYIIGGVVVVVLIIALIFSNIEKEPECKEVQVPYEAQEEYTEQVPYTDNDCTTKDFSYSVDSTWDTTEYAHQGKIRYDINFKITNNEDESGYFKYQRHFRTLQEDYGCKSSWDNVPYEENSNEWSSTNIYAKSTETIQCNLLLDEGVEYTSYLPRVVPPQKEECETTTKYKTEAKYRTITKYKTETQCN